MGQVAHSNASKAPGLKGVPDSLFSSLAYPLPSDFSPPRKIKQTIIIIKLSYYFLLIVTNFNFFPWRRKMDLHFSAWRKRKSFFLVTKMVVTLERPDISTKWHFKYVMRVIQELHNRVVYQPLKFHFVHKQINKGFLGRCCMGEFPGNEGGMQALLVV